MAKDDFSDAQFEEELLECEKRLSQKFDHWLPKIEDRFCEKMDKIGEKMDEFSDRMRDQMGECIALLQQALRDQGLTVPPKSTPVPAKVAGEAMTTRSQTAAMRDVEESRRRRRFYRELNDVRIMLGMPPVNHACDPIAKEVYDRSIFVKIHQEIYPISCEVLGEVFAEFGSLDCVESLNRGFHSTIRFSNKESTIRAFNFLNGWQIYEDCCQLELVMVEESTPPQIVEDSGEQERPYEFARSSPTNLDEESGKTSNPQSEAEVVYEESEESSNEVVEVETSIEYTNVPSLVELRIQSEFSETPANSEIDQFVDDSRKQNLEASRIEDQTKQHTDFTVYIKVQDWKEEINTSVDDIEVPTLTELQIQYESSKVKLGSQYSVCDDAIGRGFDVESPMITEHVNGFSKISRVRLKFFVAHKVFDKMINEDFSAWDIVSRNSKLDLIVFDPGGDKQSRELYQIKCCLRQGEVGAQNLFPGGCMEGLDGKIGDDRISNICGLTVLRGYSSVIDIVLLGLQFVNDLPISMAFDKGRVGISGLATMVDMSSSSRVHEMTIVVEGKKTVTAIDDWSQYLAVFYSVDVGSSKFAGFEQKVSVIGQHRFQWDPGVVCFEVPKCACLLLLSKRVDEQFCLDSCEYVSYLKTEFGGCIAIANVLLFVFDPGIPKWINCYHGVVHHGIAFQWDPGILISHFRKRSLSCEGSSGVLCSISVFQVFNC